MRFDSILFLQLFVVTLAAFWLLPKRFRGVVLLAASIVFYGAWSFAYIGLIVATAGIDYIAARRIDAAVDRNRKKRWLWASMVSNLLVLGFFKYAHFLLDSASYLWPRFGEWNRMVAITLPVGISFYTFQSMSYVVDVYRGDARPTTRFFDFFLFVLFFPQLVAGPIERFSNLNPQLLGIRDATVRKNEVVVACALIVWGFFKKLVVSDSLSLAVDGPYADPTQHGGATLLVATYAFALQIFCDFSAYSDIARGVALLFGVKLMRNFRLPYLARNPSDFWRRWHISLSQWIRDYLYIPLGGAEKGKARTVVNLLITMALAGLWHGAAWHFVAFGLFHGLWLGVHRVVAPLIKPWFERLPADLSAPIKIFFAFHLVCIGWIFFRANDLGGAFAIIKKIAAEAGPTIATLDRPALFLGLLTVVAIALMAIEERFGVFKAVLARTTTAAFVGAATIFAICLLSPEATAPFIYFRF